MERAIRGGRRATRKRVGVCVAAAWAALAAGAGAAGAQGRDPGLLDRAARLEVTEVTLEEGLRALQRSSGVAMAFSPDVLPGDRRVSCACAEVTVEVALERMLEGTGLIFLEGRRQVLVGRRDAAGGSVGSTLVGRVVEAGTARPVPAAEVVLQPGARRGLTGDDGRFVFREVSDTAVVLEVTALGYRPARAEGRLDEGRVDGVRVALERAPIPLEELVIAPGRFGILDVRPTLSGATVSREDIEAIPQLGDDAFRTLKRMPGVSTDDISTRLNVRGGTHRDVLVRLDGLELFEPYHLKDLDGALGIVDVQSLGSIDLVTGGFGVEYGDKSTAIFDMRTRQPPAVGTRTTVGMSLSSLSLVSQGGFHQGRGQWLASLRRGFLEYVLAVGGVEDEMSPAYWDVLGRAQYLLGENHLVSAQLLYAGDEMGWTDEASGSRIDSDWTNGYGWLTWRAAFGPSLEVTTLASVGRLTRDRVGRAQNPRGGVFAPLTARVDDVADFDFAGVRQDWRLRLAPDLVVKAGVEHRAIDGSYDYASVATRFGLGDDGGVVEVADSNALAVVPSGRETAAWGALRGRLASLVWEGGVRYDRQTHTGDESVTPRVLLRWDAGDRTSLRGSWGRYVQSQGLHELPVQDGEATFSPGEEARQVAVGVERRFGSSLTVRAEAYDRRTNDPLPEFVNLSREVNPLSEVESDRRRIEADESRARGVELLATWDGVGPVSWSAGYALAETENLIDGVWFPRTLDQRHTVNLHGAYRFGDWQFSGSWQYHTGWPFTEQILDVAVRENDHGNEVNVVRRAFGPLNGERLPAYHRLDLRLTRTVTLARSRLELFLDVFNAYNRTNLRGWEWRLRDPDRDGIFTAHRSAGEEQLPILPTLGFRWVF
ncbi:MAG: TonB-dependent receptor [Longimicrobiales bacterium]